MEARTSANRDRPAIKVLVVDDHAGFRTGLAAILAQEGFGVDTAASGVAALGRAVSFAPDVILMDVDMPEMSGIEATRRLLQVVASARVVMLGHHQEGWGEAISAGACGYVGKYATLEQLVVAIATAACGHHATTERVVVAMAPHRRAAGGSGDARLRRQRRLERWRRRSGSPGTPKSPVRALRVVR